jgi:hypothetical protein
MPISVESKNSFDSHWRSVNWSSPQDIERPRSGWLLGCLGDWVLWLGIEADQASRFESARLGIDMWSKLEILVPAFICA